jgi:hypothetical protein
MPKASLTGFFIRPTGPNRQMVVEAILDGKGNYHVMITRHRNDRGYTEYEGKAQTLLVTRDANEARAEIAKVIGDGSGWLHSKSLPGGRFR